MWLLVSNLLEYLFLSNELNGASGMLVYCRKEDKLAALIWILREFVSEGQPSIVFASTRHHVEFLYSILQAAGLSVACVYGAMDQV